MAKENDFKHLELVLQREGKKQVPKKQKISKPPSVINNIANRRQHSQKLYGQARTIIDIWSQDDVERNQQGLPVLSDKKPLLIKIPAEYVDIDYLRSSFGFEVVCEYEDGLVIVATKPEEFNKGIQKILDFANEVRGSGNVAKINDLVVEETKQQRLKRILSDSLFLSWDNIVQTPDETILIEMSVECQGTISIGSRPRKNKNETDDHYNNRLSQWEQRKRNAYEEWDELCRKREAELERIILSYNGEIIQIFDFIDDISVQDSFEIKAQVPNKCLVDLALNYPFVFEIKQPDDIGERVPVSSLVNLSNPEFAIISPEQNAPTVCIIDSGIQEGHVYLEKAIRSDLSKCFLPDRTDIDDQVKDGGHGTRVAGAVLYPNGVTNLAGQQYSLPCYVVNARVLDENRFMPKKLLPSKVIGEIIKEYAVNNGIRLFNHSISAFYPCLTKYMTSWAATIDNSSFEKDILFIQAAGNLRVDNSSPFRLGITQHLMQGRNYPNYLLENSCRIPNPAQSMLALTVGSININDYEDDDWISFGGKGAISSYSCSGFGLWGSIKPEVVEYGGDIVINKNQYTYKTTTMTCPELIRVSPPAYAKDEVGTSFAAPKVSRIAVELQKLLPNESTLLYKALIIQSARWTDWAEIFSMDRKKDVLRLMGYGLPDIDRAVANNEHRITYITRGERTIPPGYVHIYRVRVPQNIRNMSNSIRIDVTLTFSAKPRRTRKGFRGYFSTWVDWMSSKFNEDLEAFASRTISMSEETELAGENDEDRGEGIPWVIGARDNWGLIKGVNRSRSASQKDWAILEAYKLPEEFCIAVIGHKGWSTNGEHVAKYAMCVSFEAINGDVDIYAPFAQVEIPLETEQEIETEIEV